MITFLTTILWIIWLLVIITAVGLACHAFQRFVFRNRGGKR